MPMPVTWLRAHAVESPPTAEQGVTSSDWKRGSACACVLAGGELDAMLRHVASWGDRNPQHAVMDAAVDPLSTRHHPGPWRRSCFATWVFAGRRGSHLDHHPGRRVSLAFSRPRTARSTPA